MARWFRGRRKSRAPEERSGDNPPQQEISRTGEGALQPIYPDLKAEPEPAAPDAPVRAEAVKPGQKNASSAQGAGERQRRRRGGRGSGSRKRAANADRSSGREAAPAGYDDASQPVAPKPGANEPAR